MDRVPVFDLGDTLSDSRRLIGETVRNELSRCGLERGEMPEFNIYEYNIYRPSDLREFADEHGVSGFDPGAVSRRFVEKEDRNFVESGAAEVLKRMNSEFGAVGLLSDNTAEAGKVWKRRLEDHGIEHEGFVISEEVGAAKPEQKIFLSFEEERPAEGYVYFGNHAEKDGSCTELGWGFVQVTVFDTFGTRWTGTVVDAMVPSRFVEAFREVET